MTCAILPLCRTLRIVTGSGASVTFVVVVLSSAAMSLVAAESPLSLEDVWAPVAVAVPPADAARDLCLTDGGEIRHYGRIVSGGQVRETFISSKDCGLNWSMHPVAKGDPGALVRSPWSGEWVGFKGNKPVCLVRSKKGPGDPDVERTTFPDWDKVELRQLLPLRKQNRWIAAFSVTSCVGECYKAAVAISDDDGRTWRYRRLPSVPGVKRLSRGDCRPHWFNDGCEPTVTELRDGTLLVALRTSGPHMAFCRSADGGETWSVPSPDPAFWQANTMPYFFRLKDGRLLLIWNNTALLPTLDASNYPELRPNELDGTWESAFTNRDALHAAISEDDGLTWRGFREIALAETRNAPDFRELGDDPAQGVDKSVHQTQAVELPGGKVLLAYGQHCAVRRMAVFDPDWLLETSRRDDFSRGLGSLSVHLYVKSLTGYFRGWSGHCAWNRAVGARIVRDPDTDNPPAGQTRSNREVLQLCRIADPRLVSDRQGVVWNFPAATSGRVMINCRLAGEGFQLTLADHWMNPCDEFGPKEAAFSFPVTGKVVPKGRWHDLTVDWDGAAAVLKVDGMEVVRKKFESFPRFGLSYLHLQTLAERDDALGTYFRIFEMTQTKDRLSR